MKTAKYTFYCHTCRANDKPYVGQTLNTMEQRWGEHVSAAKNKSRHEVRLLSAAIRKYGPDAFDHEVLEVVVTTQQDADRRETDWIQKRNSLSPHGYNLLAGGKSTGRHHEDTKRRMSEDQKKRMAALSSEQRAELFKKSIHNPDNWTPERIARQLAALRSEKSMEKRRKAIPRQAEKMRKFQLDRQATLTDEQNSEIAKKAWETRRKNFSQDEISRQSARGWTNATPEVRAERARKMSGKRGRSKMSDEAKRARAEKVWAARFAKYGPLGHKLPADLIPFVRHWLSRGHSAEEVAHAFETSVAEVERVAA